MDVDYIVVINELRDKLTRLITLYEASKSDNEKLLAEKNELITKIENKEKAIEDLEKKMETLKLANAFEVTSSDTGEAKRKIGKIVREIDNCIALLNR